MIKTLFYRWPVFFNEESDSFLPELRIWNNFFDIYGLKHVAYEIRIAVNDYQKKQELSFLKIFSLNEWRKYDEVASVDVSSFYPLLLRLKPCVNINFICKIHATLVFPQVNHMTMHHLMRQYCGTFVLEVEFTNSNDWYGQFLPFLVYLYV